MRFLKFNTIYGLIKTLLILTGIVFLILYYALSFYKKQQENQIKDATRDQLQHEANSLINMNSAQMMQTVNDYSLWDDLIKAINTKDSRWLIENMSISNSFHYNYVSVYNLKYEMVYSTSNAESILKKTITKSFLDTLYVKKNIHFFIKSKEELIEVCASTIHPTYDLGHNLTKPSGYMFVTKLWDQNILIKLAEISGTRIALQLKPKAIKEGHKTIHAIIQLLSWDGKPISAIVFTRSINQSFDATQNIMYLLLFFGMAALIVSNMIVRKFIHKPLNLVSIILKTDDINAINTLKNALAEYGRIGNLFEEYVNQKLELKRAKEIAKEEEEKFRAIFEYSIDAVGISKKGINIIVNKAYATLFGTDDINEFKGKSVLEQISPSDRTRIQEFSQNRMNGEYAPLFYETIGIRKSGEEFPFEIKIGVYILNNEEYTMAIINDISEKKIAEQKILQFNSDLIIAKEKAEENDRLKTAFLQNLSHEIRTPMNAIIGFSKILVENNDNKPLVEKYSGIITQKCKDLLAIINDILDISKIESGQVIINHEHCNINHLFEELKIHSLEQLHIQHKKHITIDFDAQGNNSCFTVNTDIVKLKQIFTNLINNAIKFTDEGSIHCGCKLDENDNSIFYVTDTGIGIDEIHKHKIFERFIQLDLGNSKLVSGTGLGLSIVKGLVDLLGGEIWVESEIGKGSTFYFSILDQTTNKILEKQFKDKQILIVEDDYFNAEYTKTILAHSKCKITHTTSGIEAIELVRRQDFDLVLLDIRLPDIDGHLVTKKIKEIKPLISIIAQTASASEIEKQKAFENGCADYLCKPIQQQELLGLISKYL